MKHATATNRRIKRNALGKGFSEIKPIASKPILALTVTPFESTLTIKRRLRGVTPEPIKVDWNQVPAYWTAQTGSGIPVKALAPMPKMSLIACLLRNLKK